MSKMITKQDIRRYLKLMKETENNIMFFYEDIAKNVNDKQVKKTMQQLAKEEEKHGDLIKKIIKLVG